MSVTLTDRVSVSVREKTGAAAGSAGSLSEARKANGRDIADTLTKGGNSNISDEMAETLGNTTKPVINDEQGNKWISMSDLIAAGKTMAANGAFDETTSYTGVDGQPVSVPVISGPMTLNAKAWQRVNETYQNGDPPSSDITFSIPAEIIIPYSNGNYANLRAVSKTAFTVTYTNGSIEATSSSAIIDGVTYSFFRANINPGAIRSWLAEQKTILTPDYSGASFSNPDSPSDATLANILFGTTHTTGGSLIDWDAPDDVIEEQIRQLHETWDVTEHEGSALANGTYVLAGPIELNPAD